MSTPPIAGSRALAPDLRGEEALRARLAELEDQSGLFALAMRGTNEGLWEWNPITKALTISPRLLSLLGRTPPGPEHTNEWLTWVHPEDRGRYEATVSDHLRGRTEVFICEYRVRHAGGHYVWMLARGLASRDEEGVARRMVGSVGDVTARKEAEAALIASKREADLANHAKSMFLANMSHELRTPLNAMIGFTDIMHAELYGPLGHQKYREHLEDIRASAHHLSRLIGDILDVAKIEVGQVQIDDGPITVSERLRIAARLSLPKATAHGVQLIEEAPEEAMTLRADGARVLQILSNLASNAIKFTPEGGTVALFAGYRADGGVDIGVRDDGVGIDPSMIPALVEPFRQLDDVWSKRSEGVGLGLYIVKALAEMHQAELVIDSAPGAGATVTIRFPPERTLKADHHWSL